MAEAEWALLAFPAQGAATAEWLQGRQVDMSAGRVALLAME